MRKLNVLDTNYNNSGLHARILALNNMTLLEFFENENLVNDQNKVRVFNQAIETVDESVLIGSAVSLITGHKYFSAFDLLFKILPGDTPDSYRLWVDSEGVTDTIVHTFKDNQNEIFMNVKAATSTRTGDLYLNLFGLTIGQTMSLETSLYYVIDMDGFDLTDEDVYYYYRMYRYLKNNIVFDGFTYMPKGQSKYNIAYVNKTIDDPIAELNGHTLREVFEDANEADLATIAGITNGLYQSTYDSKTKIRKLISNGSYTNPYCIIQNQPLLNGVKYFIADSFKTDKIILNHNIFYIGNYSIYLNPPQNTWLVHSDHKLTNHTNHILYWNEMLGVAAALEIRDYVAINTVALGIDELTKSQLEYYYELWLARKNITKKVLTYADMFELYNIYDYSTEEFNQSVIDEIFDENITQAILDENLVMYNLIKNIVIYPKIYVPTEPIGLGNRFKLLSVDDNIYGHELDFEDISFKMYFGVNYGAYKGYNDLMNMLKSNKAVIEYDWGIGSRYGDVRLLSAPKTEKETSLLIISKFTFKLLNPFYELIELATAQEMTNELDLDSPIKMDLAVSSTTVSIKLLDDALATVKEISFDFTGISTPFTLTIDPETKKILIDGITDAYDYIDHMKESFIYLPGDSETYTLSITGAAVNKITYKKWVIA